MKILEFNQWLRKNYPDDKYLFKAQFEQIKQLAKKEKRSLTTYYALNRKTINPKPSVVALFERKASTKEITKRILQNSGVK